MDSKYLVWLVFVGIGALLGAYVKLGVLLWGVIGLVVFAFVGGFAAAFLQLIEPELLLLLMAVLPVAMILFGSAALSNALIGPGAKPRGGRGKG